VEDSTHKLVGTPVFLLALDPTIPHSSALGTLGQGHPAQPAVTAHLEVLRAHARILISLQLHTHGTNYIGAMVEPQFSGVRFSIFVRG